MLECIKLRDDDSTKVWLYKKIQDEDYVLQVEKELRLLSDVFISKDSLHTYSFQFKLISVNGKITSKYTTTQELAGIGLGVSKSNSRSKQLNNRTEIIRFALSKSTLTFSISFIPQPLKTVGGFVGKTNFANTDSISKTSLL